VYLGVGMNFKLLPSRVLRLGGGLIVVVRSWNAKLWGLLK
jgi:hypothetical protein